MKSEATPGREGLLGANMQASAEVGPLQCSQGGYPYNGDHIEYWKIRALKAECRLVAKPAEEMREATIEECAKILDGCAQDWNRIRDPGMANNARAYARKIRALSTTTEPKQPGQEGVET